LLCHPGIIASSSYEQFPPKTTFCSYESDNGAPNAAQHAAPWLPLQPISGSNGPFLGEKTTTWEGGLRVPGIVVWPRVVGRPAAAAAAAAVAHASAAAAVRGDAVGSGVGLAGTVSEALVSTLDVFATILDAAGVPLPADRVMDSHSLLPLLDGACVWRLS
jgi:arylsulfatase A